MSVPTPTEHHLTLNRLATVARLVAGAAHEVNNALQVIGGSAELLQNRTDLPEPVQKTLTRIRDQAARAASAMTGVVALSRPQPDGAPIRWTSATSRHARSDLRRYSIGRADLTVQLRPAAEPQLVQGQRAAPAAGGAQPDSERRAGAGAAARRPHPACEVRRRRRSRAAARVRRRARRACRRRRPRSSSRSSPRGRGPSPPGSGCRSPARSRRRIAGRSSSSRRRTGASFRLRLPKASQPS